MPQYCCVPGCRARTSGHHFPKDPVMRMLWRIAIKREEPGTKKLWDPKSHDRVCREHFREEDYVVGDSFLGEKQILKAHAVPSVFAFTPAISPSAERRRARAAKRTLTEMDLNARCTDVEKEEIVETSPPITNVTMEAEYCEQSTATEHAAVQCDILTDRFSIKKFMFNPTAIQFYTSFDHYDHFMLFFNVLGPAVYKLDYVCTVLSPQDQLFMTLMKLRQAKEDVELSILFGVSQSVISRVIITWINFMYFQLQEIDSWPEKKVIQDTMPQNFRKQFPSTRVILDATEIPINKPSNVQAQCATFSTYKNKNTLKTMIGCTPRGLISYVSDSYGGAASDRQIIERSPLCTDTDSFFEKGDSIMADRGIMVQDLFATKDIYVNTPTMLKGKSQLEPEEVVHDRRVASKRIHIEREIGLGKTFKIMKKDMSHSKILMGSRIKFICFKINNFRKSIVGLFA